MGIPLGYRWPALVPFNALLRRLASEVHHTTTFSITDALCPNGICRAVQQGVILRYDRQHFSEPGAEWIAPRIYRQLVAIGLVSA